MCVKKQRRRVCYYHSKTTVLIHFFFFNLHIFILIICEKVCVSEHVHIHMQYLRLNITGRYDLRTMLCFHKTGKM